jgi:hypothetical protein
MAEIVQVQVQAATGVYEVLSVTSKGLVRVTDPAVLDRLPESGEACYRICLKDPDTAMARYLMDQIVGKPKERVEVSGSNSDAVPTVVKIVHEHYPAASVTSPGGNRYAKDVIAPHHPLHGSD